MQQTRSTSAFAQHALSVDGWSRGRYRWTNFPKKYSQNIVIRSAEKQKAATTELLTGSKCRPRRMARSPSGTAATRLPRHTDSDLLIASADGPTSMPDVAVDESDHQ